MKSFIISAVVGTAILAIHGVNGAIIPDNAVKRAIPAAVSSATDISSRDVSTAAHVTPATACVHTGGGLVECTATLSKRAENAATALAMNNLDKRVPVIDSPLPTNQLNARGS
ncbi:MAG: hypothetical protein L6R40_005483 [Gallowayella cf. fulva]|nr:MAG: hypothetical protein L6R40_005483 [Xanthomendoza cf. fulva]